MPGVQFIFEAIGTHWQIDIFSDLSEQEKNKLEKHIHERIEIFDATFSRFRADSWVTQLSQKAGLYQLPPDGEALFELYKKLYDATDGAVTPLIGQILADAGYDATYSLETKELHAVPEWDAVISLTDTTVTLFKPALLVFGAAGKGYLVDCISRLLENEGISQYCVDAGGDIYFKNNTPARIGMENPENTEEVIGIVTLNNQALCGSAGNRRAWGDWHHIINPHTHISPRHIAAVWVIASSAALADGLTTALFFSDPNYLKTLFSFEYTILFADFHIEKSDNFSAEFFLKNN
jgi:thiamine biosynthesis lipoprotein